MTSLCAIVLSLTTIHLTFITCNSIPLAPRSRQIDDCVFFVDGPLTRTVLQMDGYAEDELSFSVCADSNTDRFSFHSIISTSSSFEVLPSSNIDLFRNVAPPCLNVTAMFIFDSMVGKTQLSIDVQLVSVAASFSCELTVDYIIAGISIFETSSDEASSTGDTGSFVFSSRSIIPADNDPLAQYVLRSGSANAFSVTYRNATSNPLHSYDVRIQYPDGSSSSTRSVSDVASSLFGIRAEVPVDYSSPIVFNASDCPSIAADSIDFALLSDNAACGLAISMGDSGIPIFAFRLRAFKDGYINSTLLWPDFTINHEELSIEEYYNSFYVNVIGEPPPLIENITFSPQFLYRSGGQLITVVLDNVNISDTRTFLLGNQSFPEIAGAFRKQDNGLYVSQFETLAGNGTDIPWVLETTDWRGIRRQSTSVGNLPLNISYSTESIIITSVYPPWGSVSETITLTGYFDGFDQEKEGHNIFIGDKSLSELGIEVSSVDLQNGEIQFPIPDRELVGSAYEYSIEVALNGEKTESTSFEYIPTALNVAIRVFGGTYSELMGEYVLGACEYSSYIAVLPPGVREPDEFTWSLITRIDGVVIDILETYRDQITVNRSSLQLQASIFGGREGVFVLTVTCSVYGRVVSADATLRRTAAPVIGVTLPELSTRSIAVPDIPQRIDAIVTLPDDDCFRVQQDVIYRWTYNNIQYSFSQANLTDAPKREVNDLSISELDVYVTRIGRELIIPQSKLLYGNQIISLFVYINGSEFVFGNATTSLHVKQPELFPVIGYDASRIKHRTLDNLSLTAERSKNPDIAYRTDQNIDRYLWNCSMTLPDGSDQLCPNDFTPAVTNISFVVSSSVLQQAHDQLTPNDTVSLNVCYTLTVSIGTPMLVSYSTKLDIELLMRTSRFPELKTLIVKNGRGTLIDRHRIRFYDDIVIQPSGVNVTWTFSVFASNQDTNLVETASNLISGEGYFDPNRNATQALPLGIKGGALGPARAYDIVITVQSALEVDDGLEIISVSIVYSLQTVDAPKLLLPSLGVTNGDFMTLFSASARVNLDSSSTFAFFFFLVSDDGEEVCLDGCSGLFIVQFRILEVSRFRLLVRLRDLQGKPVLDEQYFKENITISSTLLDGTPTADSNGSSSSLSFGLISSLLQSAIMYGDHGTVQTLSSSLARRIRRSAPETDLSTRQSSFAAVSQALNHMRDIVYNSVPNVFTARSYIQTANMFCKISPQLIPASLIFPKLTLIVDAAILQVPITEPLDVEADVLEFYNLSMVHLINPFKAFSLGDISTNALQSIESSKTRGIGSDFRVTGLSSSVSQFVFDNDTIGNGSEEYDPASLLVGYFEFLQQHLSIVLSRDAVCGSLSTVNTSVENGVSLILDTQQSLSFSKSTKQISTASNLIEETPSPDEPEDDDTFLDNVQGSFLGSFQDFQALPLSLSTSFSLFVICDASWSGAQTVRTPYSSVSRCDSSQYDMEQDSPMPTPESNEYKDTVKVTDEPSIVPDLVEAEFPQHQEKRLFILMETMDYGWLTGLIEDKFRTAASYLITTNITELTRGSLQTNTISSFCYSLNTSVPRVGVTENRGCSSANAFAESKFSIDNETTVRRWILTRQFKALRTELSQDNSSTIAIKSNEAGVMGVIFSNCPADSDLPSVALPEIADQIPYMFIGATVTVSSILTVSWTAASANYATFTGSGLSV